ncbi:DUF4132 domain-containing protein [Streptomyces sp. NPDC058572]|uniref:DUF4132 domain-containing protein n=1 Tax=Streptomyces sp. NPDC058572 TaxID=3346546 RepID=UPI00364E0899
MGGYEAEQLRCVRQHVEDDNMGELAVALVRIGALNNTWHGGGATMLELVRALPQDSRLRLANAWVARHRSGSDSERIRGIVLTLVGIVGRDLPDDLLSTERLRKLEDYSRVSSVYAAHELQGLAEAELAAGRELSGHVVAVIRRTLMTVYYGKQNLGELAARLTEPVLNPGEAWADQALGELADLDGPWRALLEHALTATAARPSAAWERTGRELIAAIGAEAVRTTVLPWLALAGRPRTLELVRGRHEADINQACDPYNANALRGLAWLLALLPPHPETARALGALTGTMLRKVPGVGPRSPKIANASVTALARIEGEAALAELARLATRVTYKGTVKLIDAALEARAAALGLSRDEIEELAVPAYVLTGVGHAVHRLGESTAELTVTGSRTRLTWLNAAGKRLVAPPAAVKRDHPDELKELKAAAKDIDKMLSAQTERLDRQFLARRTWTYKAWRERCLDHPLVGTLARRLLWTVDGTACGFADGELRGPTDDPVSDGSAVTLWHPVGREAGEVVAWRDWLERHGITQPFKQAHREVYPLTDAERTTGTYSNRFAGHILRQHQFHSLAAVRGWTNKLRLCVDDSYTPAYRELPQWGLRAEYWIEGEGEGWGPEETTESGSYLRLRTDQVRLYPIDAPHNHAHAGGGPYEMWLRDGQDRVEALPLTGIPDLVLSEVLRDVDLFVGVASIGNDPTWQDGGPGGRFREYWTSYGFGELNQSAETRRDLLTRLVPRLAIADRCVMDGRFLHVRGDLHTYKIHLGSGNILRTPNDQYVCIVPKAGGGPDTGYLPFEGDGLLSVILSKAMMLARDAEITDPTIVSQL